MDNKPLPADFPMELFVTTDNPHAVTVHVNGPYANTTHKLRQTFTVTKGQVQLITVHQDYRLHQTELSSKGISINANHDIMVYGINKEKYSDDGFLALPTDAIGMEYYTASYSPAYYWTVMLVVGVHNQTQVSIRLADNANVTVTYAGKTYHGNDWINVTINKFDTFEIHSVGDLTGSYILANNSVSVLSGNRKTTVGDKGGSRDHLVEQLLPVQSWGKNFALIPLPSRTTGDEYRFIACQDNTTIIANATIGTKHIQNVTLIQKAGQFVQLHYTSNTYAHVTSDKPIMVMQYADTQHGKGDLADPAMITVTPIEQYAADYTFTTPRYSLGNYSNYFSFVINRSRKGGLRIDGHPIGNAHYHGIPGTHLVAGYVKISVGTHTVSHTNPKTVFGGFLFGRAKLESYGFPVGLLLAPINNVSMTTMIHISVEEAIVPDIVRKFKHSNVKVVFVIGRRSGRSICG